MQQALTQLTSDITGDLTCKIFYPADAGSGLPSFGVINIISLAQEVIPLGASVPLPLRGKILANEYAPLGQLLHPTSGNDYTVNIVHNTMHLNFATT